MSQIKAQQMRQARNLKRLQVLRFLADAYGLAEWERRLADLIAGNRTATKSDLVDALALEVLGDVATNGIEPAVVAQTRATKRRKSKPAAEQPEPAAESDDLPPRWQAEEVGAQTSAMTDEDASE